MAAQCAAMLVLKARGIEQPRDGCRPATFTHDLKTVGSDDDLLEVQCCMAWPYHELGRIGTDDEVLVGAGRGQTVQSNLFDPHLWDVPGRVRRLGERRYGPWAITFYRFPPHPSGGPLGGHDLALAKLGGTTYFASVHGWDHHDADAAMLIAILLTAGGPR